MKARIWAWWEKHHKKVIFNLLLAAAEVRLLLRLY